MSVHLQREIEKLKRDILSVSAMVEENVGVAVRSLLERDDEMAARLNDLDAKVDQREVEVEEECLKILALHQPVAIDLRFIVATLKIDNDLERIGDLAVSISHKTLAMKKDPTLEIPFDIKTMADRAQKMLHDSLEAFVNLNADAAQEVLMADDEVDEMKRDMRRRVDAVVQQDVKRFNQYYTITGAGRNLERIADHATNIAEDVIYIAQGKIVRHSEGEDD